MRPQTAVVFALCAIPLLSDEVAMLRASLSKLQKSDPTAAQDVLAGAVPFEIAMKRVDPSASPWRTRLLAADWLLRGHILRLRTNPQDGVAPGVFLERSWLLIRGAQAGMQKVAVAGEQGTMFGQDARDIPKEIWFNVQWIMVEVAGRRLEPTEMRAAIVDYKSRPNLKDPRSQSYAFICAAHAGDWDYAQETYKGLAGQENLVKILREPGLHNPSGYDYPPLMDLVKQKGLKAFAGKLETRAYRVQQWRQRVKGGTGWQTVPPSPESLEIRGAAAFWYKQPSAFTGFRDGESLVFRAWTDEGGKRTVEDLALAPDAARPGTWKGTLLRTKGSAVETLEVEADLQPVS